MLVIEAVPETLARAIAGRSKALDDRHRSQRRPAAGQGWVCKDIARPWATNKRPRLR